MVEQGGLFILGTERHEARAHRQPAAGAPPDGRATPGSPAFYVALDDELMRRFGGDRIRSVMDWAGLEDDTPIENKMIGRAIEGAQVKVEAYHFDIRKHLVEYDDVVNTHRDVIYGERDKILRGADLKANVESMIELEVGSILEQYTGDSSREHWDTEGLVREVVTIMPLRDGFSDPDALAQLDADEIEDRLIESAGAQYDLLERELTPEITRGDRAPRCSSASRTRPGSQHLTAMGVAAPGNRASELRAARPARHVQA